MAEFDSLAEEFAQRLSSRTPPTGPSVKPVATLFKDFKTLYERLQRLTPQTVRHGENCFLHRARVAREQDDIKGFKAVAADLMAFWRDRLQQQETERKKLDEALQQMSGVVEKP